MVREDLEGYNSTHGYSRKVAEAMRIFGHDVEGIIYDDDLLTCPNCGNEDFNPNFTCSDCGYSEKLLSEEHFDDIGNVDDRGIPFNFSLVLFRTSSIRLDNGRIADIFFTYSGDEYKVGIDGNYPKFRIKIFKKDNGIFSQSSYVPRFHFDQIRNFAGEVIKNYMKTQN